MKIQTLCFGCGTVKRTNEVMAKRWTGRRPRRTAADSHCKRGDELGLMEYVDQLGSVMISTKGSLTEQIGNLQELQRWTVVSVQTVQQRADAAVQSFDDERQNLEVALMKLEEPQPLLGTNTVQAIHDGVRGRAVDQRLDSECLVRSALRHRAGRWPGAAERQDSKALSVGSVFIFGFSQV